MMSERAAHAALSSFDGGVNGIGLTTKRPRHNRSPVPRSPVHRDHPPKLMPTVYPTRRRDENRQARDREQSRKRRKSDANGAYRRPGRPE